MLAQRKGPDTEECRNCAARLEQALIALYSGSHAAAIALMTTVSWGFG